MTVNQPLSLEDRVAALEGLFSRVAALEDLLKSYIKAKDDEIKAKDDEIKAKDDAQKNLVEGALRRRGHYVTTGTDPERSDCSICMGLDQDTYMVFMPCTHRFHRDCALNWIRKCIVDSSHGTCPVCRDIVLKSPRASRRMG